MLRILSIERLLLRDGSLTLFGCAVAAALVVCVVFPDVLFLKASLVSAHYEEPWTGTHFRTVSLWPEPSGRQVYDGWIDVGGAAWQMDPYRRFLARAMAQLQSPYWNPYVGAGVIAPDNLVSQALSLPTIISAIFGASEGSFMLLLMALLLVTEFCLMWIVSNYLKLSPLAALTAGFVFLLNGFVTSSPGTMVTMPYYFAPLVLLSLLRLVRSPGSGRAVAAVFAIAAMATNTFVPTLTLSLTFCMVTALGYASLQSGRFRFSDLGRWIAVLGALGAAALLLDAFIFGPVVDTQLHSTDFRQYLDRTFRYVPWQAFISLLSPKHFWESYNALRLPGPLPGVGPDPTLNLVVHMGIVTSLLACHSHRSGRLAWVFVALIGLVLLRLLNPPGTSLLLSHLPVFGIISPQYWSSLLALSICFAAAYAIDGLGSIKAMSWPAALLVLLALGDVFYLALQFGGLVPVRNWVYVGVFLAVMIAAAALLQAIRFVRGSVLRLKMLLLVLLVAEGSFYINHLRVERYEIRDRLPSAITWLIHHTQGPGGDRIFNTTRLGLYPDWGAALGVPQVGTMGGIGLEPAQSAFFNRYIGSDHENSPFLVRGAAASANPFSAEALRLFGVRYIVARQGPYVSYLATMARPAFADEHLVIFELDKALPRSFLVPALVSADGIPQDAGRSPTRAATCADPAFLAHARALGVAVGGEPEPASSTSPGSVEILEYNNGSLRLAVDAGAPGVVVVTDTWHRRWTATLDGTPTPIGLVDGTFRGVAVGPGKHVIEMVYRPVVITASIALSLSMALVLLLVILRRSRIDQCLALRNARRSAA